jgi:hypothetical protein
MDNAIRMLEIALVANENASKVNTEMVYECEKALVRANDQHKENRLNRLKLLDAIAVLRSTSLQYPGVSRNWPKPFNVRQYCEEPSTEHNAASFGQARKAEDPSPVNDAQRKYGAMWGKYGS